METWVIILMLSAVIMNIHAANISAEKRSTAAKANKIMINEISIGIL